MVRLSISTPNSLNTSLTCWHFLLVLWLCKLASIERGGSFVSSFVMKLYFQFIGMILLGSTRCMPNLLQLRKRACSWSESWHCWCRKIICYINSLWRWQGCTADSHLESTIITLLKGKSCHSHCLGHAQSWIVCFGLAGPLHKHWNLFLTPSHVTNKAKVCCREYFQKQRRYWLCNMYAWRQGCIFFSGRSTFEHNFEWLAVVRDLPPIYQSKACKKKNPYYFAHILLRGMRKKLYAIYNNWRELIFLLQKRVQQYYS